MKGFVVVLIVLVAIAGVVLLMYVSANNAEVGLRNQATQQQKNLENVFDRTWKIIQQQAQIANEGKEAFKEIYPALMEGRYGNARGGALLSFITEQNPQFDLKLYDRVAASVEAQRTDFAREQTKLLDIKRQHDDIRMKIPSSFFVGGRPALEVKIITSSKTEEVFQSGKDDDVDLFKRDKKSNQE